MIITLTNLPGAPAWRNSDTICALADRERHLGHIVKIGEVWYAFDATHSDGESTGFLKLGSFMSIRSAKHAVEVGSCGRVPEYAGAA